MLRRFLFSSILIVIASTATHAQTFKPWTKNSYASDCTEKYNKLYGDLKEIYKQGVEDRAASPDYLQAIAGILEKYSTNNAVTNLLINGDFNNGIKGWVNESKYMGSNQRYNKGIDFHNGYLRLSGMQGANYYISLSQEIYVKRKYDYYIINFDWMVPEKAARYGAAYIIFDFFDNNDNRIGRVSSLLTSNSAHTHDYWKKPLSDRAFLLHRIFNKPFSNWKHQEFDTRDMPGMNVRKVHRIKVLIAIQNDAGCGANMNVDNLTLTGY